MTDEQQKDLIRELLAIREGMATKADLAKLEEGLTGIIIRLAESAGSATQTERTATWMDTPCDRCNVPLRDHLPVNHGWVPPRTTEPAGHDSTPTDPEDTPLRKEINRLIERVDRLSNWYQGLHENLANTIERVETLERSATQTEQTAPHFGQTAKGLIWNDPCGICGESLGAHVIIEHTWVPTPATETPAQDSTKTNPEKPCDQ